MNERKCPRCGEQFMPKNANQQVCDREHFSLCHNCGNNFPWSKRKKTCSTICTAALRRKNRKPQICAWETCQKEFQPGNGIALYCEGEHYSKCLGCGREFAVADIHRPSKACSPSCSAKIGHTVESQLKRRQNAKEKYGTDNYFQTEEFKVKQQEFWKNNPEKDTRIGSERFNKIIEEKYKATNISHANVKHLGEYENLLEWATNFKQQFNRKPSSQDFTDYFNVSIDAFYRKVKDLPNKRDLFDLKLSAREQLFRKFLEEQLHLQEGKDYIIGDRNIIGPKELDFYFPNHNLAVEISPTYTHQVDGSQTHFGYRKDKNYHRSKQLACENNGVELITIFDWMNWGKTLEMIQHKLHGSSIKINARDCSIEMLERNSSASDKVNEVKYFLKNSHILGFNSSGATNYILLKKDNEIVGAAAFGKQRFNSKNSNSEDTVELIRLSFKPGVSVRGGASKIVKSFLRSNNRIKEIVTFSDCDLGSGNIYNSLGFSVVERSSGQQNFVHPTLVHSDGSVWRIRGTSLVWQGADRLLRNFPNYIPVGLECRCFGVKHNNAECLPSNQEILLREGFVEVFDCGYKKWSLSL